LVIIVILFKKKKKCEEENKHFANILTTAENKKPDNFHKLQEAILNIEDNKQISNSTNEVLYQPVSRLNEFKLKLDNCPSGIENFAEYEKMGIEIWSYLFPEDLGEAKPQVTTSDGTQRRDVLFRNNKKSDFFKRIADRFDSDFLIIDFKNYKDPIGNKTIWEVEKYANKALGRFIIIVSRKGNDDTALEPQIRLFRDRDILISVVSDKQMLEMIERKEKGEDPGKLLDSLVDEILIKY
jgi:hypothetical protein